MVFYVFRSRVLSIAGSMRLKVCSLELSETGLRRMAPSRHSAPRHAPPSFLLEYQPPRSCLGQQSNPIRLCSRRVSGRSEPSFTFYVLYMCSKTILGISFYFGKTKRLDGHQLKKKHAQNEIQYTSF